MRNRSGFNLLTMSAIVLALGVVMSAALGFYNVNNIKRRVFQTRERFNKIELAIQNYVLKNGKFPCPSALNCNENGCENTSDKFGFEKRDSSGNCIYGNLNTAVFKSTNSDSEVILYGAVPFVTLGIANNYSVDAWGNKIVYMIPLSLAKDNAFQAMVSQKKDNDNAPEYLKDGLTYMLMSFERNRQGAFPYNNTSSNYFSGNENMPVDNFTVNEDNKKYLYSTRNFRQFEITGLEGELQECEELFIEEAFTGLPDSDLNCVEFTYTGSQQTFNPADYGLSAGDVLKLEVWGAQGGGKYGAKGGYSYGYYTLTSDSTIFIYIGGSGYSGCCGTQIGGWNGGGNGWCEKKSSSYVGGGGGATDIRINGISLNDRIIVAGGGGGGSYNTFYGGYYGGNGGGGGLDGGGGSSYDYGCGGNGGTLSYSGAYNCNCGGSGNGATGGSTTCKNDAGGGGGYYGGSSGGGTGDAGAGGGGGSGYIGGVTGGGGSSGINSGNGKATICYDGESTSSRSLTFPKAKFGEVSFSKEICPRSVNYPAKSSNYYYMSNYRDGNGVVIDNRAAKRCGRNGKWESGYVYECVKIGKCSKPSTISSYSSKDWSDFDFEIVNTGSVYDKARTVEMKCIINNSSGAKWYDVN